MEADQHRPTLKVLEVLELLSQTKEGYGLGEIAVLLKIPKGSLFPVIHTLEDNKYISIDKRTLKYTLGIKCYELGSRYISNINIAEEIQCIVKKVVSQCGETTHFAILDGKETVYLMKEESSEAIRMVSSVGKRISAHATAIGKALLSGFNQEEIKELYRNGLDSITANTITNIEELCRQVEKIKQEKVAYESEESSLSITCVAVPIEKDGNVVAAISVSVPIFRAEQKKMDLIRDILLKEKKEVEDIVMKVPFHF